MLLPAGLLDKPALTNLMQLYLYDFSAVDGADVDASGCFSYPYLDSYWTMPDHHPFLIQVAGCLAGFTLVNRHSRLHDPFDGHAVAEFFIMRKYRRMGAGRTAAMQLFARFPGKWEVASIATNVPAQAFWRSTIDAYTDGRYHEVWLQDSRWRGPVQSFIASP
jgi:predicted acetyltransferase